MAFSEQLNQHASDLMHNTLVNIKVLSFEHDKGNFDITSVPAIEGFDVVE